MNTDFIPLLPEGARWGDISDAEEEAPADAAADGHDEFETDPKRLTSRQQQIDFGKNTLGYERYLQAVPKHKRKLRGKDHDPPTPDITQKLSKRTWDGIVKSWRRHLHKFDNNDGQQPVAAVGDGDHDAAAAADTQLDAAPMADAAAAAAKPTGSGKRWRASSDMQQGRKQQRSSSSSHHLRQGGTAHQQGQECRPDAMQGSARQLQKQQQADEHSRLGRKFDNWREDVDSRGRSSGSGGSAAGRQQHHTGSSSSRHDNRSRHCYESSDSKHAAAAACGGLITREHDRNYGQAPRPSSSSRDNCQGSGGDSGPHRGGHRSQQQLCGERRWQPRDAAGKSAAAAHVLGSGSTNSALWASCGDLAYGSSNRQLTPAKRGCSSQGGVDPRPLKHG